MGQLSLTVDDFLGIKVRKVAFIFPVCVEFQEEE